MKLKTPLNQYYDQFLLLSDKTCTFLLVKMKLHTFFNLASRQFSHFASLSSHLLLGIMSKSLIAEFRNVSFNRFLQFYNLHAASKRGVFVTQNQITKTMGQLLKFQTAIMYR